MGFALRGILWGITPYPSIRRNSKILMLFSLFTSLLVGSCSLKYYSLILEW
jgi:hypothetical protein